MIAQLWSTQRKSADHAAIVSLARAIVGRLRASQDIDGIERAPLGITVPDADPTPTGPPTSYPIVMAGCLQRLQRTVAFMGQHTLASPAKPCHALRETHVTASAWEYPRMSSRGGPGKPSTRRPRTTAYRLAKLHTTGLPENGRWL